jgi:hypothetical protein
MDWTVAFPFPLSEILEVAILAALDVVVSLTIFVGCLLAENSLSVGTFRRAAWLMFCLLGAFESILAFSRAAFPKALIAGPLRLLCISIVLIAAIRITRGTTRRIA